MTRGRFLLRTSIIVMVILGANKVTGFIKLLLMTRTFGVSPEADAYAAASQLPELLFAMLAGGALTAALIPIYSDLRQQGQTSDSVQLAHTMVTATLVGFGGISLLVAAAAPWFTGVVLVPDFGPEQQMRTAQLMRIMLLASTIFAVGNVFTGLLHARQHFLAPALGTVLIDLGQIGGLLYLVEPLGIYGVAWGTVIGAVLAFLVLLPALWRKHIGYRPAAALRAPATVAVARLMGPRLVALGAVQAVDLVLIRLASGLPAGFISSYFYAMLIMVAMPRSLFSAAISTVFFPTMAEQYNAREEQALRITATTGLQATLALVIPSAVGLLALGLPGVRFLFPGGRLDAAAIGVVYGLMTILSLRLVSEAVQDLLSATFYAQHNTRIPMWSTLGWMVINVLLSLLLVRPLGMAGLAWASAISAAALTLVLLWLVSRYGTGLDGRALGRTLAISAVAALAMAAVVMLLHRAGLGTSTFLVAALLLGGGAYAVVFWWLWGVRLKIGAPPAAR